MNPTQPVEVELHRVFLTSSGAFRLELRYDDDSYLNLDFEPESDGHRQINDTLTRVLTRTLSRLGERGVTVGGMTSVPAEEPEEEQ